MKVLVVDDEPLARDLLRALLGELPGIEVAGEAADGIEALAKAQALRADLVFLDIDMPGLNGVHAAARIATLGAEVIFVTAHEAHALDAFDLGAADYLLKPVRRTRLATAVDRVRQRLASRQPAAEPPSDTVFWVSVPGGEARVAAAEILRVEAAGDHVYLHTARRTFLHRITMAALEKRLEGSGLLRVHRSAFVRPEHVAAVLRRGKRLVLRLVDGAEIPVGPSYRATVLAAVSSR